MLPADFMLCSLNNCIPRQTHKNNAIKEVQCTFRVCLERLIRTRCERHLGFQVLEHSFLVAVISSWRGPHMPSESQ